MIVVETYEGICDGPTFLLCGAIHGDEPCGPLALGQLMHQLSAGTIVLQKGRLIIMPVCNPKAYKQGVRYLEKNLARVFASDGSSYEEKLAIQIKKYIINADYIVDIHSLGATGAPFVLQDYVGGHYKKLARAAGIPTIISGRPELYVESQQIDVTGYAHIYNIPSIVIEAGQHDDPASITVAYDSVINILAMYGLIESQVTYLDFYQHLHMYELHYKRGEGVFEQDWYHGQYVNKGMLIATDTVQGKIYADRDAYIVLPKSWATTNEERFYLAYKK